MVKRIGNTGKGVGGSGKIQGMVRRISSIQGMVGGSGASTEWWDGHEHTGNDGSVRSIQGMIGILGAYSERWIINNVQRMVEGNCEEGQEHTWKVGGS
jgi:hypothetical protein